MFTQWMKRIGLMATVVVVGMTCMGFSYQDKTLGFSLELPEKWEMGDSGSSDMMVAMTSWEGDEDAFRENMNIIATPLEEKIELETLYNLNLSNAEKMLSGFKALEVEKVVVGGKETYKLVYSFSYEKLVLKNIVYLTIHNNTMYTITFATIEGRFEEFRSVFEGMATSVQFTE